MIDAIRKAVAESLELKKKFFSANEETVAEVAREIAAALEHGKKVLLYGNGEAPLIPNTLLQSGLADFSGKGGLCPP